MGLNGFHTSEVIWNRVRFCKSYCKACHSFIFTRYLSFSSPWPATWLLILYVIPHLPRFFLIMFDSTSGLAKLLHLPCFWLPIGSSPKCFFLHISGAVNIQQGTIFWRKLMYLVCQRCDLGITPLRLRESWKWKTNKPQRPTNQKNT